jgi:trehalose 6-phosphate synthase
MATASPAPGGRETLIRAFPISIDTKNLVRQSRQVAGSGELERLKQSLQGRRLIIGVDRLDYTKGLYRRFRAVERLLAAHEEFRGTVEFLQIAPPTRSELHQYRAIKDELEQHAGRINGVYADYDWVPIRYLHKPYSRRMLTGFFRTSAVGLVTPLRDGMNLVAKEDVAAQDPEDPGVLVLSRFAGAACELDGALIVNPYDFDTVGDTLAEALRLPREERIARHRAMLDRITLWDVTAWRKAFEAALAGESDTATELVRCCG